MPREAQLHTRPLNGHCHMHQLFEEGKTVTRRFLVGGNTTIFSLIGSFENYLKGNGIQEDVSLCEQVRTRANIIVRTLRSMLILRPYRPHFRYNTVFHSGQNVSSVVIVATREWGSTVVSGATPPHWGAVAVAVPTPQAGTGSARPTLSHSWTHEKRRQDTFL